MTRTAAAMLAIVLGAGASLHAELKIVSRTSVKTSANKSGPAVPLTFTMFGEMMVGLIAPDGPVEMTAIVATKGARVQYAQSTFGLGPEMVMLGRPNGDRIVLHMKERVYLHMTEKEAAGMWQQFGFAPVMSGKHTGEFSTIAGMRAERVAFEWSMAYPLEPDELKALPPDAPKVMTMSGDLWVAADRYKEYAPLAVHTNIALMSLGMRKLLQEAVVLQSALRSPMFDGREIETIVTSIAEEAAPPGAFEIPAGFKRVSGTRPTARVPSPLTSKKPR